MYSLTVNDFGVLEFYGFAICADKYINQSQIVVFFTTLYLLLFNLYLTYYFLREEEILFSSVKKKSSSCFMYMQLCVSPVN